MSDDDKPKDTSAMVEALRKYGEQVLAANPSLARRKPEASSGSIRSSKGKTTIRQAVELLTPKGQRNRVFEFYWLCFKVLGRRASEAGMRDFVIGLGFALCTGIAAFLLGDHDWLKALVIALSGLMLWLWAVVLVHFAEAPSLIHLNAETELRAKAERRAVGIGGIALLVFLLFVPAGLTWWYVSGRSLEGEPRDSLRSRTVTLANKVQHYLEERADQHPPYADLSNPNPTEEQKQKIAAGAKYDGETWNHYRDTFMEPMVAIVKEYKSRGVETGFLENGLTQHFPWGGIPGVSNIDKGCMTDLCKFKELAYHVDAKDTRIDIP